MTNFFDFDRHKRQPEKSTIEKTPSLTTGFKRIFEIPMAANVEIYTWSTCPFCIRAKALLVEKGVDFTEYCIDGDEDARDKMAQRANGKRSLPEIFINDRHVGGCNELYELDSTGELDRLLT